MTKRLALLAFLLLPALPARAQDAATTTMRSAAAAPGAQAPALRLVAAQRLPRSPVGERIHPRLRRSGQLGLPQH